MTFRLRHLFGALLLHVLLFGLLAGGAQCSAKPVRPPPMQGVLLDASRAEKKADQKNREEEAERKKREAEKEKKKRQEEEEHKKQEDLKKQEQEKLAAETKKKKEDAEKKKKDAEADKKRAEADRKKKEEDKNKKAKEDEKKKQEDAQRELQDKLRLEDEMRQESLKRESDKRASEQASAERATKQSEWAAQLSRAIARKWTRPASATQSFTCTVRVLLLPDATVSSATIVKSCGNSSLDKSVEDAAYRASPLPKPSDPSVFDRDLIINFEPGNQ